MTAINSFFRKHWSALLVVGFTAGLLGGNLLSAAFNTVLVFCFIYSERKSVRYISALSAIAVTITLTILFGYMSAVSFVASVALSYYYRNRSVKDEGFRLFRTTLVHSFFISLCCVFLTEWAQGNIEIFARSLFFCPNYGVVSHFTMLGGAFLLLGIILLLGSLLNYKISYCATLIVATIFSVVNFYVFALTHKPFILSDIRIFSTAMSVASAQSIDVRQTINLSLLIFFAIGFIVLSVFMAKKAPTLPKKKRVVVALTGFLCLLFFYYVSTFISLGHCGYSEIMQTKGYGFITNLYVNQKNSFRLPKYAKDYALSSDVYDGHSNTDFKPNVIIVMNEAFSDLEDAVGVIPNNDPLPYFHSLCENYPSGTTYASVIANKTVSSEWEILTGISTGMTEEGSMIYQTNLKPMNTLVSMFNGRGYNTVSLHPYDMCGYNRNNMYRMLGFSKSIFQDSISTTKDDYIREYISDKRNYEEVISVFEDKGEQPIFIFNITMQNHGGYSDEGGNAYIAENVSGNNDINEYLSLLHESDEALKLLIEYFESVEEPTIILFFGDHQPNIDIDSYEQLLGAPVNELSLQETTKMYEIPYLIWANYDIDGLYAPEYTSTNYLPSILFKVGGIVQSGWMETMDAAQADWPVVTAHFAIDASGNICDVSSVRKTKTGEAIDTYRKLSYGILYGVAD